MAHRIVNGYSSSLRDPHKRELPRSSGFDHGLKIADPGAHRDVIGFPAGEPVGALIVTNDGVPAREFGDPVAPDRAVPFVFQMIEPVRRLNQWIARPDGGVGDAHPVICLAVADLLAEPPIRSWFRSSGHRAR